MSNREYQHSVGDLVTCVGDDSKRVCIVIDAYTARAAGITLYVVDRHKNTGFMWQQLQPVDRDALNKWHAAETSSNAITELNRIALIEEQIHTASQRHDGWSQVSVQLENTMQLSTDEDAAAWFAGANRKSKSIERKVRALRRILK